MKNYIAIATFMLLLWLMGCQKKDTIAKEVDACISDSPPNNEADALSQLKVNNTAVKAAKIVDWGWKFQWPTGKRFTLTLPACVCVDYNQKSSTISGEVWRETRGPEWTRALIGKNGGTIDTPGGATIYWSVCERK